jgi:hypothetical protein
MKGLFPRLQHRSLQSMNDLFSLLNQTQCCHFLDPEKLPNMEKRGYQSMFFILIEMINLLFLQKHSIQSDECVPYPLTLFIGCLIVNMFICLEQSSPGHLEHIQNVTSVIKSGWIWSFI